MSRHPKCRRRTDRSSRWCGCRHRTSCRERPFTLYRHDPKRAPADCSAVFPVRQEVPASPSVARLLVESLIRMEGSPFPEGSEVGRIVIANRTASVDFNERLRNVGGACRAQAIRASLERTLRELPNLERVAITAQGSESQALQP